MVDLLALIEPWMTSPLIYPITAGMAAGDVLFPIIPAEGAVIAAGVFAASAGTPNLLLVIVAAAVGAIVGDHISYAIGRSFLGPRLIRRSRRLRAAVEGIARQLDKRGGTMIVSSRFIPGGRTAVTLACGMAGYPLKRFARATVLGGSLWAVYGGAIGFLGGAAFAHQPLIGILAGVGLSLAITGVVELVRWRVRRHTGPIDLIEPKPSADFAEVPNSPAVRAGSGG
jgi:membrane-associated protein